MKNTIHVLSVTLLSATTLFAQVPGSLANLTTETPAESDPGAEADHAQGQNPNQPIQISKTNYETINSSADAAVGSALSQSGSVPSKSTSNLHIFWIPGYLWLSGISGNVGARNITVPINASFSDVFDNLNIGFMSAVDVNYRGAGLSTDVVYIKLTTKEQSTPFGLLYSSVRSRAKTFFIEPDVYGRVIDTKKFSMDVLTGVRVWRLDNGIDLGAGLLPALSVDSTNVWADPLVGARFRVNFKKGLFAGLKGDAGIGPNETWQIYAGGGKEIKQKYSVILAYRVLNVHRRDGGFLFDASMKGMLLGFGIRFR